MANPPPRASLQGIPPELRNNIFNRAAPDLDEVKTHLENCPECQSEHDLELIIRDVVKRSCEEKAPQSLKTKIMQRIEQLKDSER